MATTGNIGGLIFRNLLLQGSTGRLIDITNTASNVGVRFENCRLTKGSGTTTYLLGSSNSSVGSNYSFENCELDNAATGLNETSLNSMRFANCDVHDLPLSFNIAGFRGVVAIVGCRIWNITGAAGDGITLGGDITDVTFINNTVYNVARDGMRLTGANYARVTIRQNNFWRCGGFGLNYASAYYSIYADYNSFYSCTSGSRSTNTPAGLGDVVISGTHPTNSPVTSSTDMTPNTANPGGAQVRLARATPSGNSTDYIDLGGVQSQDAAGGGGGLMQHSGMTGGLAA
jgi:hypothetical protein